MVPKISVIMSVYKEPVEWMCQSIDSILDQTFGDFEFIIINDNPSRDDNHCILRQYAEKDSRIVIISNLENIGLTKSLNKGLDIAKGEYIARMDADDISMPDRLEKQLLFMDSNPDVIASGAQAVMINETGKKIGQWSVSTEWTDLIRSLLFRSPIVHPLAFFKRTVNNIPIYYDESYVCSQDYALWATLIKDHKIVNLDDILLQYRISTQQISTKNNDLQTECAIRIQEYIFNNFNYKVNASVKNTIEAITKNHITKIECHVLINDVVTFAKTNNNLGGSIMRTHLFKSVCNYVPFHYNIFCCFALSVRLSLSIKKFDFYSFASMLYKCVSRKRQRGA